MGPDALSIAALAALAASAAAVDVCERSGWGRCCEVGDVGVADELELPTDLRAASSDALYDCCRGGPGGGDAGWSLPYEYLLGSS